MCDLNGVSGRVQFMDGCDPQKLREYTKEGRGLLISDCEGYELDLLLETTPQALVNWDLIVEVHDSASQGVLGPLLQAFSETHVTHVERRRKRLLSDFPSHLRATDHEKHASMAEGRSWRAAWLICESKGAPQTTYHPRPNP
jgi:hypothetical protein